MGIVLEVQCYSRLSVLNKNRKVDVGFPECWDPDFGTYLDYIYQDGYPKALDINSGNPIGIGVLQSSILKRSRVTAAAAFLTDRPANLTVMTNCVVERVIHDGRQITGVALSDRFSKNGLAFNIVFFLARR